MPWSDYANRRGSPRKLMMREMKRNVKNRQYREAEAARIAKAKALIDADNDVTVKDGVVTGEPCNWK